LSFLGLVGQVGQVLLSVSFSDFIVYDLDFILSMTPAAILLVILSSLIHTTWSILAKRAPKNAAFYGAAIGVGVVCFLPVCVPHIMRDPQLLSVWPYFVISGATLALYYVLMAYTYEHADISIVYPLLRMSPIFTTIAAVAFLHERVTVLALIGIIITMLGCMMLPLRSLKFTLRGFDAGRYLNRVYGYAVLAAASTAIYFVLDKYAMTLANPRGLLLPALSYVVLEMAACSIVLIVFAAAGSKIRTRRALPAAAAQGGAYSRHTRIWQTLIIGPMIPGAYVLIVAALALPGSSAAYISAFRMISVVMTVLAGIILLKEQFGRIRIIAAIVISIGLVMVSV